MSKKIFLIIGLLLIIPLIAGATLSGTYTSHNLIYLPGYGSFGLEEYNEYNTYQNILDNQVWTNKTNIAAIDLSLYYLKTEIDTLPKVEAIYGVNIIDNTELATYCETTQDYLKTSENNDTLDDLSDNSINDLLDVNTIGKAAGKLLKFDASGNLIVGDDIDTNTTYTGTANEIVLTGTVFSLHSAITRDAEWDTQGKVEAIWGTTLATDAELAALKFIDLTDTPANYTGSANKFLQVNSTPDAIIFDTISTADLSDKDYVAMLNEGEMVTTDWSMQYGFHIFRAIDVNIPPFLQFERRRDGDPTFDVAEDDILGEINFLGKFGDYNEPAASIKGIVDGIPSSGDMPGRLEFSTTPDGSNVPALRMAIDNAGNIKMGDGAWTNYIKVTSGGAMTAEGTASIKATDLVISGQAAGDILYFNGTNWIRLAKGTAGQVLTMNATGTAPEWKTP